MSRLMRSSKFARQPGSRTAESSRPCVIRTPKAVEQIALREMHGVIAELRHTNGGGKSLPRHFHEEYQIILSEHRLIEYHYRSGFRESPLGTLFVIHRGEAHSTEVIANTTLGAPLRTFLIPESAFASLISQERPFSFPCLSSPIVNQTQLFHRFTRLHRALFSGADPLTAGCMLFETIGNLGAWAVSQLGASVLPQLPMYDALRKHQIESAGLGNIWQLIGQNVSISFSYQRLPVLALSICCACSDGNLVFHHMHTKPNCGSKRLSDCCFPAVAWQR